MTVSRSVADILAGQIAFEAERIDRTYPNV